MNARLTRALAEGERYTPDADTVMAGVRAGIARNRRRRRYASAGVAALTVLAMGSAAALIGGSEQSPSRSAEGPAPNAQTGPVPPQECRLSFGWLPEGLVEPIRSCGPRTQSVLYPMDGGPYLNVSIDQSGWQGPRNTRGWKRVTVNGEGGYITARPTRAFVRFPLPSGRWVDIEYGIGTPGAKATAGLEATVRRIAEEISETPTDSISIPFAPTYLPPGQHLADVGQGGGGTSLRLNYQDGSGRVVGEPMALGTEDGVTSEYPRIDAGVGFSISWASDPAHAIPLDQGERIADIQGRPAYLFNRGQMVVVDGFHDGQLNVSTSYPTPHQQRPPSPGHLRPELVRIAEGVDWLR